MTPRGDGKRAACDELGSFFYDDTSLIVLENTDKVHNLVVCTLCSCRAYGAAIDLASRRRGDRITGANAQTLRRRWSFRVPAAALAEALRGERFGADLPRWPGAEGAAALGSNDCVSGAIGGPAVCS